MTLKDEEVRDGQVISWHLNSCFQLNSTPVFLMSHELPNTPFTIFFWVMQHLSWMLRAPYSVDFHFKNHNKFFIILLQIRGMKNKVLVKLQMCMWERKKESPTSRNCLAGTAGPWCSTEHKPSHKTPTSNKATLWLFWN